MYRNKISAGLNYLSHDQRTRLIHGALKSLGVDVHRDDYNDLFQEGCLLFAHAYANFPETVTKENERRLMNYAYRQIRWRLLDQLRRHQHLVKLSQYSLDTSQETAFDLPDTRADWEFARLEHTAFIQELLRRSHHQARRYLKLVLSERFKNDTEIAQYCGVTKQAVCQWRRQVIKTGRQILREDPDML